MKNRLLMARRACIALAILAVLPGALVYPSWRSDLRCFENLRALDHRYNCDVGVLMAKEEGGIDASGRWDKEALGEIPENRLLCPSSGAEYHVEFIAGIQPVCPTHDDLMKRFQYVTHLSGPPKVGLRPYLVWGAIPSGMVFMMAAVLLGWGSKTKELP